MQLVLGYMHSVFTTIETSDPFNEEAARLYNEDMEAFQARVIHAIVLSKEKIYEKEEGNPLVFKEWNPRIHESIKPMLLSGKVSNIFDSVRDGEMSPPSKSETARRKHSGFSWVQESPKK